MRKGAIKLGLIVLATLIVSACGKQKKSVNEEQVMGDWKTIIGENEHVRFEKVDSEYVYSAYTYNRLATSGTWEIERNEITINFDNGTSTTLSVEFIGDTMLFNNGDEKYIRLIISGDAKTPVEEIGDVQILEQVIQNINFIFSDIEPFNEDWVAQDAHWQKIRTEIVLKKNDFTELNEQSHLISEFLIDRGFVVDTTRISTFMKGNLCVMIRSNTSPKPSIGQTVSIDIISGIEK